MKRFLLDTHIIIWLFNGDERLSDKAREEILNEDNEIYFSTLSIFEIELKRLTRPDKLPKIAIKILELCFDSGFKCLSLELNHVLTFKTLKRKAGKEPHRDPFDNLMLAQATAEKMTFITHDERIAEYESEFILKI